MLLQSGLQVNGKPDHPRYCVICKHVRESHMCWWAAGWAPLDINTFNLQIAYSCANSSSPIYSVNITLHKPYLFGDTQMGSYTGQWSHLRCNHHPKPQSEAAKVQATSLGTRNFPHILGSSLHWTLSLSSALQCNTPIENWRTPWKMTTFLCSKIECIWFFFFKF